MDLMKLFQDEALIEILQWSSMSIESDEDEGTRIYVIPDRRTQITKIQMETMLDFFGDYQIELILIDDPIFRVSDYDSNR